MILLTLTLEQYQECNTLVTRIEVRIMRLQKGHTCRIKGALQTIRDPNVPNKNTGIILSIIPVLILVIIYYSIPVICSSGDVACVRAGEEGGV